MWRRWRSWRRREKANAERGARNTETRNAERGTRNITGRYARRATFHFCSAFRLPTSALGGRGGAVKYFVTIGAQTVEVEVDGDRVLVGGEAVDVHLAPLVGTPLYHLLLAGASWTVPPSRSRATGAGRWEWWASEWKWRSRTSGPGRRRRAAAPRRAIPTPGLPWCGRPCPAWSFGWRWRMGSGSKPGPAWWWWRR